MGLTDNTKQLIRALTENNLQKAKRCAIACLAEDTTVKNTSFVSQYKSILEHEASVIELPSHLKNKVEALDVSLVFQSNRYYKTSEAEQIVSEIQKMRAVSQKLALMQIPYLNATLLYGEPGTGKTMLAKYVAYTMNLPYVYLNFSQVIDSLMGKSASTINQVFSFVKTTPCVFVIDEIDAIAIKRNSSSDSGADGEMNRVTITLLQELDSLPNNVILIACTNRIDRIDEAILSRFPSKKALKKPSDEEKERMINQYLDTVEVGSEERKIIMEDAIKETYQREIINALIRSYAECLLRNKKDAL